MIVFMYCAKERLFCYVREDVTEGDIWLIKQWHCQSCGSYLGFRREVKPPAKEKR